jgi:hypothetical protein
MLLQQETWSAQQKALTTAFSLNVKARSTYAVPETLNNDENCLSKVLWHAETLVFVDALPRSTWRQGDLLVNICYASLNPIDFRIHAGYRRQIMERKRETVWPLVLGRDGVGEAIDYKANRFEELAGAAPPYCRFLAACRA